MMVSRTTEIGTLGKEIETLNELRDFAAVTSDVYDTKRENVVLEAQLAELEERHKFLAGLKSKLDETVRKAAEKQAAERKAMVEAIMAGVMEAIDEPALQDRILKKCVADFERLPLQQL